MSTPLRDPIDVLKALRVAPPAAYLAPGADPAADAMLARITSQPGRVRHPRRRWVPFGIVVVAGGLGVTAATAVLTRQATDPTEVACHQTDDSERRTVSVIAASSQIDPSEQCAVLWTDGTFGSDGAPPLTACVTDTGNVAVLPGDDGVCATFGWTLAERLATNADRTADLLATLSGRFAGQCFDRDAAGAEVDAVLAELGLEGWAVADGTLRPESPCIAPGVDAGQRTIYLSSAPG